MNEKILENREQIDKADEQIFDLLLERLDAVTAISFEIMLELMK